jgi:uncharacterized protein (UPF0335 family)
MPEGQEKFNSSSVVKEFVDKFTALENEAQLLAEDRKALIEAYKDKIDVKAMKAAIRIVRIKAKLGDSESECDTYIGEIDGKV